MIPQIEWSISLGTILQLVVVITGFIKIYNAVERRLSGLELKMDQVWQWFTDHMAREPMARTRRNDHR
jgi:hypothetical protein